MIRKLTTLVVTLALCFALAPVASADVITVVTFDNVPADIGCDEVWQENGVDIHFTSTMAEDCDGGGNCFFGGEPGAVWLYPSRLVVDLGATYNVTQIEVDWIDYCGIGCTQAFAYDGGTTVASAQNSLVSEPETVVLVPAGGVADRIAVSSCEGMVLEIRVTTDVVATEASTWSDVKALYR